MNFVILQDLQFDLKNVSKWKILFASTLSRLNGRSVMTDEEWISRLFGVGKRESRGLMNRSG